MPHVLKLGPVQLDAAHTNVYLLISEAGDVSQPAFAAADVDGVRALAESCHVAPICAPELGDAATSLGLPVGSPGLRAMEARAAIAVFMAWGQRGLSSLGSDTALMMLTAAAELWRGKPWTRWKESQRIEVQSSGALQRTWEASVFGRDGVGHGLALYEQKGAVEKIRALEAAGESAAARQFRGVGVVLDDRPAYAVQALATAGLAPRVPMLAKTSEHGASLPSAEECLLLAATMRALGGMDASTRLGTRTLSFRGHEVSVNVSAPAVMLWN